MEQEGFLIGCTVAKGYKKKKGGEGGGGGKIKG